MRKLLLIALCAATCGMASSQSLENKKSAFQLSFITPLGTNGIQAPQYTNKVSFNLLAGLSRNEEAFTLGGLANIIEKDAKGFQFAGLSNYVGNEGKGFQLAGLVNVNENRFSGFQFAGLANIAGEMQGFQFAGLINVAKDVKGFQFAGLINKAKNVDGVQFAGLINIAENSDCPIGLINIIKNGEKSIAVTYNEIGSAVISFRSGGKYTYGIIGAGYNHKTKGNSFVTEGGFGAHIYCTPWLRIKNEIKGSIIGNSSNSPTFNTSYALLPAFKIGAHYEVFAGASLNYMRTEKINNGKLFPDHSLWKKNSSSKLQQLYIGYQAGVQYIF